MENQELGYLRDELNQMCQSHSEYANRTIHLVLLIWGGVLVFLGKDGIKLSGIEIEEISLYFVAAIVFLISNLVIYYTALKYYNAADDIFKRGAYIAVFYETRPNNTIKNGEIFFWELATFELMSSDTANKTGHKNTAGKRNPEYAAFTCVSIALMFIFLAPLVINIFIKTKEVQIACIIMSLIYVICILVSVKLLREIPKYTSLRDTYGMRVRHLNTFIEYALDTGHDTEESLKNRLGKVWNIVKNNAEQGGK